MDEDNTENNDGIEGTGSDFNPLGVFADQQFMANLAANLTGGINDDKPLNTPPMRGYFGPATIGVPGISPAGANATIPYGVRAPGVPGYNAVTNEEGLIGLDGQFLVNENGERYVYDADADGFAAYYSSSEEQRELVADMLRSKGYRMETIDDYVQGYQALHQFANNAGVSFDRAFLEYKMNAPEVKPRGGQGRTYRVTSAEDIKAVARDMAYKTLGRGFTDDEANDFVEAYQQTQLRSQQKAGVVENAPSLDVAAEQHAQKVAPTEAMGIKFANHVGGFARMLGAV